jgi:hypothetical protein
MLSYEQISEIERSLGPQAPPVISALQSLDRRIDEQRLEVKRDLLVELATKADIEEVKGQIRAVALATKADIEELGGEIKAVAITSKADIEGLKGEIKRLEGEIKGVSLSTKTDIGELRGDIKRLEVFMKVLIGLAVIGMTFFSPVAAELIRILK